MGKDLHFVGNSAKITMEKNTRMSRSRFRQRLPAIQPRPVRSLRRFAPRNDTSGERAVHQCTCAVELPSARCSGNAATDAIGSYRFIARLFVSPVRRRERHAAPLQFSIEMRTKCAKKYRKHRLPVVSACQKSPFGLFRQAAFRIAKSIFAA